ncbi:dynamin family protein [Corynebacterium sp. H113]|uniref:dynamin family protein n=1 Tax=Corynebacterium sp. H113 TaxID=3133419 RepID=UPI0030A596DD
MNDSANSTQAAVDTRSPHDAGAQLLQAITTKILKPFHMNDVCDLALRRASSGSQLRSVVVVGEIKRGKSSLVNALVGQANASPVGIDVTTATSISVGQETPELAGGSAQLMFAEHAETIPHTELEDWVSCDGKHGNDARTEQMPTRAMVPVRNNLMGDIAVIDTPGVGGLEPEYATLAKATASQACVLVVVCDATTPLTAPEMQFIKDTGGAVEALIVAVTKTDKNLMRWQPIVEENKRLLREHIGRDISVVGVSSLLAVKAAGMPPGPQREQLEAFSGITQLRRLIDDKFALADNLPLANGLRTATDGMRQLDEKLVARLTVLNEGSKVLPELNEQLEQLQVLRKQQEQWELHLQRDLTMIRQNALSSLDRRLDDIRDKWTEKINKHGMSVLRKNPQYFTAEMEKDFHVAIAETIDMFLEQLDREIIAQRFDSEVTRNDIREAVLASFGGQGMETRKVASKSQGLIDPMTLMMGFSGASTFGGIIAATTFIGLGAAVGVAWVGFNLGFKAIRAGKTNLLTWLRETQNTARLMTSRLIESGMATARPEIVIRYRSELKENIEQTKKRIREAEETVRTDKATREKKRKVLEGNVKVVAKYIAAAEKTIGELTESVAIPQAATQEAPQATIQGVAQ